MTRTKAKTIFTWFLQIILGLEFLVAGSSKFTNPESNIRHFENWGYPENFYIVIGVLEMLGGVLMFIPKLTSKAAILLGVIMLGATATHLIHAEWNRVPVTAIIFSLLAIAYYLRKNDKLGKL